MAKKLIFLAITLSLVCSAAAAAHKRVKLTDVKAITLKKGEFTTGRRSSPVLQLQCRGSFCNHAPDSVQCINVGTDGNDVQWKCEADLPDWLSFKFSDVSCEGYEYPTDPYILAGSCGMTYSFKGEPPVIPVARAVAGQGGGIGGLILVGIILWCCCNSRGRGHYVDGGCGGSTAGAAAAGAAVGYAAGRASGGGYYRPWGWGGGWGGYGRRRHSYGRSGGWGGGRRGGGRRTATTFSGTSRR